MDLLDVLQPQPLCREPRAERVGARIGEHAPRLLLERAGRGELVLRRQRLQLRIGRRAPDEIRQPRREIDVGDAIGAARVRGVRLFLEPEDEMRAREDRLEHFAHAVFKPAGRPARPARLAGPAGRFFVEGHQAIDLARRERPPVRLGADARDDLPRARTLLGRHRRPAAEDLLARRRLGDPRRPVRPFDDEVLHVRQRRDARPARAAAGERPVVRPDQILVRPFLPPHEGRRHLVLPRLHEHRLGAHRYGAASVGAAGRPRFVLDQRDALAVD